MLHYRCYFLVNYPGLSLTIQLTTLTKNYSRDFRHFESFTKSNFEELQVEILLVQSDAKNIFRPFSKTDSRRLFWYNNEICSVATHNFFFSVLGYDVRMFAWRLSLLRVEAREASLDAARESEIFHERSDFCRVFIVRENSRKSVPKRRTFTLGRAFQWNALYIKTKIENLKEKNVTL